MTENFDHFSDSKGWSCWYVRYMAGKGIRYKTRSSETAVHGGAGSVSQMVVRARDYEYELGRIENVAVIRFRLSYLNRNPEIIDLALPLTDFLEWREEEKKDPLQGSLKDW